MLRQVTLQDIADQLGLHLSTVSRALRNDRRLPAKTHRKVQACARKLGYRPNANARALAIYRQTLLPASLQGTITLLSPLPNEPTPLAGARAHAEKLGYQIDVIHSRAPDLTGGRLTRILKARGTSGLMVLPTPLDMRLLRRLKLDWSQFPAVALGHALFWPHLHRVSDNHFRNAKHLVRKLTLLGYRRIGLCLGAQLATLHADGGWRGGYVVEMERWGECPRPYYRETDEYDHREIQAWIRREKLDAVIMDTDLFAQDFLRRSGLKAPEDIGVACLSLTFDYFSGIDPEHPRVWAMAVDFLVHLIHTNQSGIPEFPHCLLLEGTWKPGKTVRRINFRK